MTRAPRFRDAVRFAWASHREVPYRWSEIWTAAGRRAHYDRWLAARTERVNVALHERGLTAPPTWSGAEVRALYEVLVDRCYDVEGFVPRPGDVVIDGGCSYGDYTCVCARLGARVVAFDPDPENVRHTRELLGVNHLDADVRAAALGLRDGSIRLGRLGAIMLSVAVSDDARDVPAQRVDSLSLAGVSILKLDVEGMELDVLEGSDSLVRRDRPRIIVEVHGPTAAAGVARWLSQRGYRRAVAGPTRSAPDFGFIRNEFWAPT